MLNKCSLGLSKVLCVRSNHQKSVCVYSVKMTVIVKYKHIQEPQTLFLGITLNPKPKFSKLLAYFMTCDLIPCPLPQQKWEGNPLRTNRHYKQTWAMWVWRFHRAPHDLSVTLIAGNAWTLTSCCNLVQLNGSSGNTYFFISLLSS